MAESTTAPRQDPMKFFLDTADVAELQEAAASGLVDGVTTNPSLAAKTGQPLFEALRAICDLGLSSVSAEVTAVEAMSSPKFANYIIYIVIRDLFKAIGM